MGSSKRGDEAKNQSFTRFFLMVRFVGMIGILGILGLLPLLHAEQEKKEIPAVPLTVPPTTIPQPLLRYELLPNAKELTPGNAALTYARAALVLNEKMADHKAYYERFNEIEQALNKPIHQLPLEKMRIFLGDHLQVLREIRIAAQKESCDWGLNARVETDGIGLAVPEIQKSRELASILQIQIRLHTAEGRWQEALDGIQTGLAMARHVGNGPILIQALFGMSLFHLFAGELELVMQLPEVPNLYWSLSALPRNFVDLREPMKGESRFLSGTFPSLKEIEQGPKPAPEMNALLIEFARSLGQLTEQTKREEDALRLQMAAYVALNYPHAKKSLLTLGKKEVLLDAMPPAQVVVWNAVLKFRSTQDEIFLWVNLPFYEGYPGMKKTYQRIYRQQQEEPGDLLSNQLQLLIPAIERIYLSGTRVERCLAALRVIEAVRLHAAQNKGQLPEQLTEIHLPIPHDPFTGKPFAYRALERSFQLRGPAPDGEKESTINTIRYDVTIRN